MSRIDKDPSSALRLSTSHTFMLCPTIHWQYGGSWTEIEQYSFSHTVREKKKMQNSDFKSNNPKWCRLLSYLLLLWQSGLRGAGCPHRPRQGSLVHMSVPFLLSSSLPLFPLSFPPLFLTLLSPDSSFFSPPLCLDVSRARRKGVLPRVCRPAPCPALFM